MSLTSLLLFASTEFFLSLSPGPAVLLVMAQALRSGAKASLLGALGIITGNAVYFAISALSLGAILIASDVLFYLIKWTGATYLVYLGGKMLHDSLGRQPTMSYGAVSGVTQSHLFRQGLLTQLANPKAILFFTAILPQFINPQASASLQFSLLGLTSIGSSPLCFRIFAFKSTG